MVICLLLAVAALLWPLRSRGMHPGRRRIDGGPGAGVNRSLGPMAARRTRQSGRGASRPLILGAMAFVAGLLFVVVGVAGLIVAATVLATGTVLVRRALVDRRGRVALIDIAAGLRMFGRELRAGAEPAVAAANAGAAAKGDGAEVLLALARLARADDRSGAGFRSEAEGRPAFVRSALHRGVTGTNSQGTARSQPDDPRAQVTARLRSGWLLTRRHGLAFTPLIDALAADLSEQIAAEADRAGQVAGPRMSGYVMAVLPLMGLALGVGMGADPFRVLLLTPVGNLLLLVGVLLTCAGLLWSARIVRR